MKLIPSDASFPASMPLLYSILVVSHKIITMHIKDQLSDLLLEKRILPFKSLFSRLQYFLYFFLQLARLLSSHHKQSSTKAKDSRIIKHHYHCLKQQLPTGIFFQLDNTTFSHHMALVNGIQMHYVIGGRGDPVVLLHGWPETWYEWHKVMPALLKNYTVIAPDLRGEGDSSKPLSGYDGKTVVKMYIN